MLPMCTRIFSVPTVSLLGQRIWLFQTENSSHRHGANCRNHYRQSWACRALLWISSKLIMSTVEMHCLCVISKKNISGGNTPEHPLRQGATHFCTNSQPSSLLGKRENCPGIVSRIPGQTVSFNSLIFLFAFYHLPCYWRIKICIKPTCSIITVHISIIRSAKSAQFACNFQKKHFCGDTRTPLAVRSDNPNPRPAVSQWTLSGAVLRD